MRLRTLAVLAVTAVVTGCAPPLAVAPAVVPDDDAAVVGADASGVTVAWGDSRPLVPTQSTLALSFTVPAGRQQVVQVTLDGARLLDIPQGCAGSSTVNERSSIDRSVTGLRCWLGAADRSRTLTATALVVAAPGESIGASARPAQGGTVSFPRRPVGPGTPLPLSRLRLISSPDFLNADVGDLHDGPASWRPGKHPNSTNAAYERSLDTVLDDWASLDADAVMVAGDLVEGWWGTDPRGSGTFGPVATQTQRERALARAADTYYPQWVERFRERGLQVLPAMGDHEYGDDPWGPEKGALARTFEREYARHVGGLADRAARAAGATISRPDGVHRGSAYAYRPAPQVQVVSLNVFDIGPGRARVQVDDAQLRWLRGVLERAERDGVAWTVVQGHTPILGPVRKRASSGLMYEGGRSSALWRLFEQHGVDLYLAGEVHDVTTLEAGGVTQITHGGAFQFGLTTYLVMDFTDDYALVSLRDYDARHSEARDGSRLWETRPAGLPRRLTIDPEPFSIGTGILIPNQGLVRHSGALTPRRAARR